MKLRRKLPYELIAEIVEAIPWKAKIAHFDKLEADEMYHDGKPRSTIDDLIVKNIKKLPFTPINYWNDGHYGFKGSKIHSSDKLTINFKKGGGAHSKFPMPQNAHKGVFYFEVLFKQGNLHSTGLRVGLTTLRRGKNFQSEPRFSCAYEWCGGFHLRDKYYRHKYGPFMRVGQWIGCGVHLATRRLFFTKTFKNNAQFLGVATILPEMDPSVKLFPFFSIHRDSIVEANFGRCPFKFQFDEANLKKIKYCNKYW